MSRSETFKRALRSAGFRIGSWRGPIGYRPIVGGDLGQLLVVYSGRLGSGLEITASVTCPAINAISDRRRALAAPGWFAPDVVQTPTKPYQDLLLPGPDSRRETQQALHEPITEDDILTAIDAEMARLSRLADLTRIEAIMAANCAWKNRPNSYSASWIDYCALTGRRDSIESYRLERAPHFDGHTQPRRLFHLVENCAIAQSIITEGETGVPAPQRTEPPPWLEEERADRLARERAAAARPPRPTPAQRRAKTLLQRKLIKSTLEAMGFNTTLQKAWLVGWKPVEGADSGQLWNVRAVKDIGRYELEVSLTWPERNSFANRYSSGITDDSEALAPYDWAFDFIQSTLPREIGGRPGNGLLPTSPEPQDVVAEVARQMAWLQSQTDVRSIEAVCRFEAEPSDTAPDHFSEAWLIWCAIARRRDELIRYRDAKLAVMRDPHMVELLQTVTAGILAILDQEAPPLLN